MNSAILIITDVNDTHIELVTKHLKERVIILDPADILEGRALSYEFRDNHIHVTHNGEELPDIKSVWYRKPKAIWGDELPVPKQYRRFSETAVLHHVRELYSLFPASLWVSDFYAIRRAAHKSYQQQVAAELGFNIPDTLATSDKDAAKRFVQNHSSTIIKSLATVFPEDKKGQQLMFYSNSVTPNDNLDFNGLHLAPIILQQAIDRHTDIRVTVIGDELFATSIRPKKDSAPRSSTKQIEDWRPGVFDDTLEFKECTLPKSLAAQCVSLTEKMGLKYGAIDLIKDSAGKYWFLEINPNGQWAFVEKFADQPLGEAMARLLSKGL